MGRSRLHEPKSGLRICEGYSARPSSLAQKLADHFCRSRCWRSPRQSTSNRPDNRSAITSTVSLVCREPCAVRVSASNMVNRTALTWASAVAQHSHSTRSTHTAKTRLVIALETRRCAEYPDTNLKFRCRPASVLLASKAHSGPRLPELLLRLGQSWSFGDCVIGNRE